VRARRPLVLGTSAWPLRRGRLPAVALAVLAGALGGAPASDADTLVPRSGPKVRGRLVKQDAQEVLFNPYWSPNPKMTWEVIRLPADQVKKLEIEPHPEPEFYRRLQAAKPDDADALTALSTWAGERKLKAHAAMASALAAVAKPGPRAAPPPGTKADNPLLNPDLAKALKEVGADADPASRARRHAAIKAMAPAWTPEALERIRRSALQPTGRHEDVPLSMHADRYPGAVYTVFVPKGYDPSRPWPLLIGLHGGGPDGKAMDEVVGSGDSAMTFYDREAAERGVIVACPNALMAGWGNKVNEDLVRDLITEMRLLYHVDIDRIHLTGHSMGGYGTWALGPKMAEIFATISPMAGAGGGGVDRLVETKTPIFIYHSADDYIDVNPDRQAARQLRESDLDFIYTELNGHGHGYPDEIREELFDFLMPRRNFDPAYKDAWPRSSFLGKVSAEEKAYLGDPAEALGPAPGLEAWLAGLRLGGGRARACATSIGAAKPEGAAEGLAKLLKDEKLTPHARAEVARAVGLLGEAGLPAAAALRKAIASPAAREASALVVAAAQASALVKDPEAHEALQRAVAAWVAYFEDKLSGEQMRFSDWQRSLGTLASLVGAWADLGGRDATTALEKGLVPKVLGRTTKVDTSERVPQDPSKAFQALAKAVARCYAAGKASAGAWDALLAACGQDGPSKAAVEAARKDA
jgi:dienelactone hydrolase